MSTVETKIPPFLISNQENSSMVIIVMSRLTPKFESEKLEDWKMSQEKW